MKVLVIAPHPDDEVLGCGGSIAMHSKNGDEVHLCIATVAYTPDWPESIIEGRAMEINKSSEILGFSKVHKLNFPTVKLDTIPQKEINDALKKIVDLVNPEVVYIPHGGDLNADHRIIFESSLVATRPNTDNKIRAIFSYEILSETEYSRSLGQFNPNVYRDITDTIDIKLNAMKCHTSELKEYPHPRSLIAIESLARVRGVEVALKYAEAFMLIRGVNI